MMPTMGDPLAENQQWAQRQQPQQQPGPTWAQTQDMVALLKSIRAMMVFFTVLAVLGLLGGVIGVVEIVHAANSTGSGF